MLRRVLILSLLLVGCLAGGGCEKSRPRYHVWGKITYQGQPIPAGSIHFDPDIAAGSDGPQGFALIKNGEFDTRKEGGIAAVGGKLILKVYGTDGVPQSERPNGLPLFPERLIPKELPLKDTELDVDVTRQ